MNENNTYASTHLHEPSPIDKLRRKKMGLVAVVMLVLILMCIGIGVPLSYYGNHNGKADLSFCEILALTYHFIVQGVY